MGIDSDIPSGVEDHLEIFSTNCDVYDVFVVERSAVEMNGITNDFFVLGTKSRVSVLLGFPSRNLCCERDREFCGLETDGLGAWGKRGNVLNSKPDAYTNTEEREKR
jgi:hypothetical protein